MESKKMEEIKDALKSCAGASIIVWSYSASLCALTIRVAWPGTNKNIHIICNGCTKMKYYPSWGKAELTLEKSDAAGSNYSLKDDNAGFEVNCSMIRIEKNVEPLYEVDS